MSNLIPTYLLGIWRAQNNQNSPCMNVFQSHINVTTHTGGIHKLSFVNGFFYMENGKVFSDLNHIKNLLTSNYKKQESFFNITF